MEANANVNLSCCPLRQHAAAAARSRREHPPGKNVLALGVEQWAALQMKIKIRICILPW